MARELENLPKQNDVVTLKRKAYERILETIKRQAEEIKALEYRVKTLLGGK